MAWTRYGSISVMEPIRQSLSKVEYQGSPALMRQWSRLLALDKSLASRPMNLRAWYKRPTHFSGCFSKETPWGSAKFVSSREFSQTIWRFDDRWTRLGQHVLA